MKNKRSLLLVLVLVAVTAAYWNHFQNGFHFDDSHTIVGNAYIRTLRNIPSFFVDGKRFSILPSNRTYRPIVSTTLAIDYWLSHHLPPKDNPMFWYHLPTFLWFLAQLVAMYAFYRKILDSALQTANNDYAALLATAWYGLHPANAETVNYIIQRGDVYSTAGVVFGLALFACFPRWRKTGIYLLPVIAALLSKPPALVFPLLLSLYLLYFEDTASPARFRSILRKSWPAWALTAFFGWLQAFLTPKSYSPTVNSNHDYLITQPYVWFRYFKNFVLPLHLSADTELRTFHSINPAVLTGFLFAGALVFIAVLTARIPRLRPISYGIVWFILALLPTSMYSLSDVENDHRMYFPFVGMVFAATWAAALLFEAVVYRLQRRTSASLPLRPIAWVVVILIFCADAYGTYRRNAVWRNDRSLWLDAVQKSPRNSRGLMSYGVELEDEGDYRQALAYMKQAESYDTMDPQLRINMATVYMNLNQMEKADRYLQTAVAMNPGDDRGHVHYAAWLGQQGRYPEATEQLEIAYRQNPDNIGARADLLQMYMSVGDLDAAKKLAEETIRIFPGEEASTSFLAKPPVLDEAFWVKASTVRHHLHFELPALDAAQKALKLNPSSAEAYQCLGAAYAGMEMWDLAEPSEEKALQLKPEFELAKSDLNWIHTEMQARNGVPGVVAGDLVHDSTRLVQSEQYEESIAAAQSALRIHPDDPDAYNSLSVAYAALHRWDDAIAAAKTALRLRPGDPNASQHLSWAMLSSQVDKQIKAHSPSH